MRRTLARLYLPLMLASSLLLSGPEAHAEIRLDLSPFDSLKFKGVYKNSEDVFKVVIPHTDIRVTSGETVLTPELGLKSWAAFPLDSLSLERGLSACREDIDAVLHPPIVTERA